MAQKSRCYAFVQKLENLPDNWQKLFEDCVIPSCFIIHDQDEADPHIHFLMDFTSPVSVLTALDVIPAEFNVLHVEPVRNRSAYMRYMLHLDQDDKFNYSFDDLKLLYGCKCRKSDLFNIGFVDVYEVIEINDIRNFAALITICMKEYNQCLDYILSHSSAINFYLRDRDRCLT